MTDRITRLLDKVETLDKFATTGPWILQPETHQDYIKSPADDQIDLVATVPSPSHNSDLIALSRTAMPATAKALQAVLELLSAVEEDPSNKLSFMYGGESFPAMVTTNEVRQAITDVLEADGVV